MMKSDPGDFDDCGPVDTVHAVCSRIIRTADSSKSSATNANVWKDGQPVRTIKMTCSISRGTVMDASAFAVDVKLIEP